MAQVIVEYHYVGGTGNFITGNSGAPVALGKSATGEEVTTSGTAADTTATATAGQFVSIYNADAAQVVWGAIGQSPTAAVETDFVIGPGERRDFGPLAAGDKVSLINDS